MTLKCCCSYEAKLNAVLKEETSVITRYINEQLLIEYN